MAPLRERLGQRGARLWGYCLMPNHVLPIVDGKSGRTVVLPVRPDFAEELRRWLADKPAGRRLWGGVWAKERHGAEMMQIDLTAANVEYEDNQGRVSDFHAPRHTFISNLARAGVHPRNARPWPATAPST
jgi:hypothetical protein